MKKYPLELENIGSDVYTLMSRGHHDFKAFMREVKEHYGSWGPMRPPEHLWFKAVPCRDEFDTRYAPVELGTRGAFPVTYTQEAAPCDAWKEE